MEAQNNYLITTAIQLQQLQDFPKQFNNYLPFTNNYLTTTTYGGISADCLIADDSSSEFDGFDLTIMMGESFSAENAKIPKQEIPRSNVSTLCTY